MATMDGADGIGRLRTGLMGKPAPAFTLTAILTARRCRLPTIRGKPVLVNFLGDMVRSVQARDAVV